MSSRPEPEYAGGVLAGSSLVAFVSTTDAASARRFYELTLGLPLVEATAYALVFDCGGTTLRVTLAPAVVPAPYTVLGWSVAELEAQARVLADSGVELERYDGLEQDALGIWRSPAGARVVWFRDPDGNLLSLTER